MNSTRIVVKALTPAGKKVLYTHMMDELLLRAKYKSTPRWRIPMNVKSYLKTVSAFVPKGAPEEHHILGFKHMNQMSKNQFAVGVKHSFEDGGCTEKDFEVSFFDE